MHPKTFGTITKQLQKASKRARNGFKTGVKIPRRGKKAFIFVRRMNGGGR